MSSWSLSARRAWIEISYSDGVVSGSGESLSARRAWIEIDPVLHMLFGAVVALRKESVDRNHAVQIIVVVVDSRSPQGERG